MYNKIKLCKGQYEYSDQDINRFLWEEQYTLKEMLCRFSIEFYIKRIRESLQVF